MQYRIICYGPRLVGYGPFDSEGEANSYAASYLKNYLTELVPYESIEPNVGTDDKINLLLSLEGIYAHDF